MRVYAARVDTPRLNRMMTPLQMDNQSKRRLDWKGLAPIDDEFFGLRIEIALVEWGRNEGLIEAQRRGPDSLSVRLD